MLSSYEHRGNPLVEKRADETRRRSAVTFGRFADSRVAASSHRFCNDKRKAQWATTQRTQAEPLRDSTLDAITTEDVLALLKPIWTTTSETASRLREGGSSRFSTQAGGVGCERVRPTRWRGNSATLVGARRSTPSSSMGAKNEPEASH